MSRELITSVASTLLPVALLALTALAAWLASLIARHIRDKRYSAAVTLLAYGAAGVVADITQHTVEALKDPTKPGKWDAVAGAAARLRAIELLRSLYPLAVDFVLRVLRDPKKVDELLGTLIERAVVDLKSKTPAVAGELVLPAVEPSKVPAAIPPRDSGQRGRASIGGLLAALLVSVLSAGLVVGGCRPQPGPDGEVHTPSGVVATIDTIATILEVLLPVIRPLILREVPDGPAKPAVTYSLTAFEAAANAWMAGHTTWDARGADRCTAYALSGALVDATKSLARDLARAGIGWGPDIEALLTSLGRLMDRQLGVCSAVVDGGALTASGRVGSAVQMYLDDLRVEAQLRGRSLRPLPAVRR